MKEDITQNPTKIVLLGTGTPNADPERSGASLAILVGETSYLVDFGPGVVRRAAAAYQSGIEGLAPDKLQRAFLTHLHSDHTAGYPDLILTPWVLERQQPLEVYGPIGLQAMTDHILAAYQEDIRERLQGLEPANPGGYRVRTHEIREGECYQDENLRVAAFTAAHGSWQAFGYKFITPQRTIVISGDTAPTTSLIEAARGCDVLIHEVYCSAAFKRIPQIWQRYHASVHTSSIQLAEIASITRPGLLILYHQLFWGVSERELLDEVRALYSGEVVSGCDLDIY